MSIRHRSGDNRGCHVEGVGWSLLSWIEYVYTA